MTSKFLIHQSNFDHTFYPFVLLNLRASQVALVVKNMPANARDIRDPGLIPGWEDPLEESMAPHSSILAWRISWTEEARGATVQDRKELGTAEAT